MTFTAGAHELFEVAHQSFEKTWASSTEDRVLSDIDGDGFVDLLSTGGFLLNKGSGFSTAASWSMPSVSIAVPQDMVNDQKNNFTLTDPVMLWTAPYSGHVRVTGAATKAANVHSSSDGVKISVLSFTATGFSGWSQGLTDATPCAPAEAPAASGCGSGRTINVRRGDRIYLRADSIDDFSDDTLAWNPRISYQDICDVNGNNCLGTGVDHGLSEPFNTGAFDFDQVADYRLAGRPFPMWRADTVKSPDAANPPSIRIHGNIAKALTSDAVTIQIIKFPNTPIAIPLPPGTPPMPLPADFVGTIPVDLSLQVAPGDRFFFKVSSATPVDPKQVQWSPQVDYVRYCRPDSIQPNGSSDPATMQQAFANATGVCGAPADCLTSPNGAGSCHLSGDPDPQANPVSGNVLFQTVPAYYQQAPWTQFVTPGGAMGLVAQAAGQVTFTGSYVGPGSRLVVRRISQGSTQTTTMAPFDAPVGASPINGAVPIPSPGQPGSITVAAGDSLSSTYSPSRTRSLVTTPRGASAYSSTEGRRRPSPPGAIISRSRPTSTSTADGSTAGRSSSGMDRAASPTPPSTPTYSSA